jgi:hypothetical protein
MSPLVAPYRVHFRSGRSESANPAALPVPWAVRIENTRAARVVIDCLKDRTVSRVEVVVGPYGRVYVRWCD